MKKALLFFIVACTLITSLSVNAFAYRAEWDATLFDDDNYTLFGGEGSIEHSPDVAVDADLESGWQKADAMDEQGNISKEYFIAMEWEDTIVMESMNIWWRSSTRAVASTEGYVVQIGKKNGNSYTWSNADVTYSYNAKNEQNGRFECDVVTFKKKTELKCFRILIKRGKDVERGYPPKLNEIELTAEIKQEPINPPPVSSESPVISEEQVSSKPPVSSEEASSAVSSDTSSENVSSKEASSSVGTPSQNTSSSEQPSQENGDDSLTPWLILGGVSLLVIAACAVLLVGNSKKSQ